jgi:DNA modification methylase
MQLNNGLPRNLLICGDNLTALDDLIKKGIKVDLIYLDPPFFSNRHYEVIWGDEAEVRSFKDRWEGGINVYVEWMKERVVKMYDVLKDTGSFYLHCDWHAGHYLKVMLDEIFGYHNFRNEVVWHYTGRRMESPKRFNSKHDVIFFYAKSDETKIKSYPFEPYTREEYIKMKKQEVHEDRAGREWIWGHAGKGKSHVYRIYIDEVVAKGRAIDSVWDIPIINTSSKERLGYPTQKPETLLERIIEASSNKSDLVLDPFCGCGTAMAVAHRLNRKWIGIDISPTAIVLIEKRLGKLGAAKGKDFDVIGMPTTMTELEALQPFEFQNWVINEMKAKQSKKLSSDFGIDGYYDKTIFTDRAGIQVKQSEGVGRNVVDNFETALKRAKYEKGYIVAFSFGKGAHEEAARSKQEGLDVKLVKVDDLLHGKFKV